MSNANILMILYNEPSYINSIKKEDLNNEIVGMLESSHFDIIDELVRLNPYIILYMKNVNEEKMKLAIESGLNITLEDFYKYNTLKKYAYLFVSFLKQDPSLIKYYIKEYINYNNSHLAVELGYIATEEDLINNPALCSSKAIMESAIKVNPMLIKYAKEDCYIESYIVKQALQSYQLTKKDFESNPSLSHASWLFNSLPEELKMYCEFYDVHQRISKVVEAIDGKISFDELPFFDKRFGATMSAETAKKLCEYRLTNISEDINSQESYLSTLSLFVNCCTNIRYKSNKRKYKFKDIVALDKIIRETIEDDNDERIENLKRLICNFIYPNIDFDNMCIEQKKLYEYVSESIDEFRKLYIEKDVTINLSLTSIFCNNILNRHRNRVISNEHKKILLELSPKLALTEKKKRLIINKLKMYTIREYINAKEFGKLGTTEVDFNNILVNIRNRILSNKKFRKKGIVITNSQFDMLDNLFRINGELDISDVYAILGKIEKTAGKFIVRKYNNIRLEMLDSIKDEEINEANIMSEKEKIDFNCNNFIIVTEKRYKEALAYMLLNCSEDAIIPLLDKKNVIEKLNKILLFANICVELNKDTIKNIFNNYIKVRGIIGSNSYFGNILEKLDDIIMLSNGYAASEGINTFILSEEVLGRLAIGLIDRYVKVYLESLKMKYTNIPVIKLKVNDKVYKMAKRWEQERLLIGRLDGYSCIDLELGGEETYLETLLKPTAYALLIRDKDQEVIGRVILVRRGNTVQIIINNELKLDVDVYKNIAFQIINNSIKYDDNIDYVVINSNALDSGDLIQITDSRFVSEFPHADLDEVVTLLLSKKQLKGEEEDYSFDFEVQPKVKYPLLRKKILFNPPESEVNRLLAIKATFEGISDDQFEPFYSKNYEKVIVGEDWFLGVTKTGEIEEFILPLGHTEAYYEIEDVKDMLRQEKENNNSKKL